MFLQTSVHVLDFHRIFDFSVALVPFCYRSVRQTPCHPSIHHSSWCAERSPQAATNQTTAVANPKQRMAPAKTTRKRGRKGSILALDILSDSRPRSEIWYASPPQPVVVDHLNDKGTSRVHREALASSRLIAMPVVLFLIQRAI